MNILKPENVEGGGIRKNHFVKFLLFFPLIMILFLFSALTLQAADYNVGYNNFKRTSGLYTIQYNTSQEFSYSGNVSQFHVTTKNPIADLSNNLFETKYRLEFAKSSCAETFRINSTNGAIINVTYHNVATLNNGRKVGLKLKCSNFVPTNTRWDIVPNIYIQFAENFSDGYFFVNLKSFDIEQTFFYEDTGAIADLGSITMQFGSLNIGEGVILHNHTNTYRTTDTLVGKTGTNQYEGVEESYESGDWFYHPKFIQNSLAVDFNQNPQRYTVFQSSQKYLGESWVGYPPADGGFNSDCWNTLSFAPLSSTAPPPIKQVLNNNSWGTNLTVNNVGDSVKFRVNQQVENWMVTGFGKYTSFSFSDVLPVGVTYKNAYIQKNGTTIPTSSYNLNYNSSNRTVTASFTSDYLENSMSLTGETYSLIIETTVNADAFKKTSFTNQASTTIMGDKANTNIVTITPKCHITTEVENGVIDATVNNITPGSSKTINYHENDGYMIKSITIDGTAIDWTTHFNSYAFTNITGNHHIKVVYEKIPTTNLTIRKNWDDANNNDGFRPTSMTVNFLKNNVSQETITLNAANNWSASKNNLRLYTPRREVIVYDWSENMNFTNNNKYKQTGKTTTNGVTTFTNTHKLEEVTSKINLHWEDTDNNDGYRPDSVKVVLYKNDEVYKEITLNKNQNWEYTEEHLLKYSPIGKENTYYWREIENYTNHNKYEILETVQKGLNTEITNYHELERVASTITKIWNDTNNNDGFRPSTIYAKLYQDDKVIKDRVILNDGNKFKQTEYNLLKFHNQGVEYQYKWDEYTTYDNANKYKASKTQNNYDTTITNTHELEKVEVHVQKIWEDNDNHDKVRPSSIQVNLLGNGKFVKQVQLSTVNNWETTITDLNKYEPYGKLIYYTFEEPVLYYDYDSEVVTTGYDTVITNTRDLTKTSRTVKKEWNDNNNQDQMRPDSVEVELLANGESIQTVCLSEDNNWTEKVNDLKLNNSDGEPIEYVFREKNVVEGYEDTYDTTGKTTTITNTYVSEKTKVTVVKKWDDNENQDGIRPTSVEMRLYANDASTKYKVTLNARNNWTDSIANLDKYKDGEEIHYEFKEESQVKGYKASTEQNGNLITITNTHVPETTESSVEKVWEDENDIYGIRPESIQVNLMANDKVVEMTTLTEANDWQATVTNLPKYQKGEEITYTWKEVEQPVGYAVSYKQEGNKTIITNSFEPYVRAPEEGISVSIKKEWDDNNNADKLRPDEIEVLLLANHRKIVERITLNEANNWSATINGLNNANGLVEYSWEENGLPIGYYNEIETNDNQTIMTNIHEPDKASITLKKVWDDDNNRDGIRPDSIKFALLANKEQIREVELTESDNWETTITDLPLNDVNGLIEYTCKELSYSKDYSSNIEVDGALITITNTHKPEMTELKVTKNWVDDNNAKGVRPEEIKVNLVSNDNVVEEIILNSQNNWTKGLTVPKYENGKAIKYQFVEETTLENYQATYQQKDNETVITNTYESEKVNLEVQKEWIDDNDKDGIRPKEVTVILIADGEPTDVKLKLNEDNDWYSEIEQPKYKNGKEVEYSFVLEKVIDKYETAYKQDGYKTIITSEHHPEEVSLKVQKVWVDDNNKDGVRPNEVTVVLVIDGKPSDIKIKLNKDNDWQAELNQPKYKDGKEIKYNFVLESAIDKYITEYEQDKYTTIITSTYNPEEIRPEVQIVWDDLDNKYQKRPEEVIVRLYINGNPSDIVITLNNENDWYTQLAEMPKYQDGKEIEYKFVEEVPKDYKETYEYDGNKTIITNLFRKENEEIISSKPSTKEPELVETNEIPSTTSNLEDGKSDKVQTEDSTSLYLLIALLFVSSIFLVYEPKKK